MKNEPVVATLREERVVTEKSDAARELYARSRYGEMRRGGYVELSLIEALYLLEKERLTILDGRGKPYDEDRFQKRARRQKQFWVKYSVYRDMRERGYIVKTALKFGADFRVYERGKLPGQAHARWVLYAVPEHGSLTWQEFSAKNRVAHSTKKRLLIGVVDDEGDVTYWEVAWMRP